MKFRLPYLLFFTLIFSISCTAKTLKTGCIPGAYSNASETVVVFQRKVEDGKTELRYVFIDGRRGKLADPDALISCTANKVQSIAGTKYRPIRFKESDTTFRSGDLRLAGRLIEPVESSSGTLVVLVHGSENTPTVGNSYQSHILAAQGLSVFVYDKRGTGKSQGKYTQDFYALASDAAAAYQEARRLAHGRFTKIGYFGGSQGGWVAPLAARTSGADFIVIGFGLVITPLEEDSEQVYEELRRAGYGDDVLAKAHEVTAATDEVIANHFKSGFDTLAEVKRKYAAEPWFQKIQGEFTGEVLHASEDQIRTGNIGEFRDFEVPWRYDPVHVLQELSMRQLWVLAGEDSEAPITLTQNRLTTLQQSGLPITIALFPRTDHGMYEFVVEPNGKRKFTRITEGYFAMIADFMKGKLSPPYGAAILQPQTSYQPHTK